MYPGWLLKDTLTLRFHECEVKTPALLTQSIVIWTKRIPHNMKEGNWKSTSQLSRDDGSMVTLLMRVLEYISHHTNGQRVKPNACWRSLCSRSCGLFQSVNYHQFDFLLHFLLYSIEPHPLREWHTSLPCTSKEQSKHIAWSFINLFYI